MITRLLLLLLAFLSALSSQLSAASVKLAWDPNTEPDLGGYRIYWGSESRAYTNMIDVGKGTTNEVPNLLQGVAYYFAVTAYSTNGLESDYSNEVRIVTPAKPAPPANLRGQILTVEWQGKTNKGLIIPIAAIAGTPGNVITANLTTPAGLVTRSLTVGTNGLAQLSGKASAPPFTASLEITKLTLTPNEEYQAAFR